MEFSRDSAAEQLDRLAIAEIIQRERAARDSAFWPEMASFYHPDSSIEVSWFKGSGQEFVDRTRLQYERARQQPDHAARIHFHEMGPAIVNLNRSKALAETACTLHSFFPLHGVALQKHGLCSPRVESSDAQRTVAHRGATLHLPARPDHAMQSQPDTADQSSRARSIPPLLPLYSASPCTTRP